MANPVAVKTKYHFGWATGKMTPSEGHPRKDVDECELSSDTECVIIFTNPDTFGMWKAQLSDTSVVLKVVNQEKTGWYLMDMPTYKAQEPKRMSFVGKTAARPQDPPVLP